MQAAIFREANAPLTIEDIDVDQPLGHEVVVRTVASGVCHSDLHVADGSLPYPGPLILGHEAAGVVEAVGDQVSYVQPGDHVVGCLSVFCGQCRDCLTGHPNRCNAPELRRSEAQAPKYSQDGKPVAQFANLGSYAEQMLVHENALVIIDKELPLDRAALVGCGVLTGVGAVLNTAKVEPGSAVAVFGTGGVGLAAIQGARIAGARMIIAVDLLDNKIEWAKELGATHGVNASKDDPVDAIMSLTGEGVDYSFEAIGSAKVARQAFDALRRGGTATVIGVMPRDAIVEIPGPVLLSEKKLQGSGMGSNRFRVDIPNYLELYRQGRLRLDEMITRRGPLTDINEAFRAMKAGEVARSVLTFA